MTIQRSGRFLILIPILIIALSNCQTNSNSEEQSQTEEVQDVAIEIVTEAMDFKVVDTIPSGWNSFRYINKSQETHFFLLDKYPEGKTLKEGEPEVIQVFQKGMDLLNEGKTEEGYAAFNELPAWFFEVEFDGGSGLLSPGQISETTIHLDPGYYVIECYVKMGNGKFHSAMGMVKELIVSVEDSGNEPLLPDVEISISSTDGIIYNKAIVTGEQNFSVYFKDQIAHENFVGHDINLVRLDETADLEALEKWMNWADPKGLITPSPDGVTFLGGVNDMSAGSTGYFTTSFEPGNYAFISEVPNSLSKNMLKTFEVK